MSLNIDISADNGIAIAALTGSVDGNTASEAQSKLLPLMEQYKALAVDMSGVDFMSSAGLRMMLLIYRHAAAANIKIALANLDDQIRDTMSITGFLSFFTVCDSLEDALSSLRSQ